MRFQERFADEEELLHAVQDDLQARIWTTMPGIIVAFDAVKQTATVQPAIDMYVRLITGQVVQKQMPQLIYCPVVFPSGGGFSLTFPIKEGDECLIHWACRHIDAWWQQSGTQPQIYPRMHDLSDGFVTVGPRSQPRKLTDVSTSTVQLRSDDGAAYVELAAGHVCSIVAPGGINLTTSGQLNINAGSIGVTAATTAWMGNVSLTGVYAITGSITVNGVDIGPMHLHSGVQTGPDDTGAVVP